MDQSGKPSPLVAVIDAEASTRRLVSLLLSTRGMRVVEHGSGREALAHWHRHEPPQSCVVDLSDAGLPLLRQLLELRPLMTVVALTPGRDPQLASEAMREGAYEHLVKPLEPDRLVHALVRAVERHDLSLRLRVLEQRLGGSGANDATATGVEGGIIPLPELERREIQRALKATNGSVNKAAKLLGLSRATLYRRLAELRGITAQPA